MVFSERKEWAGGVMVACAPGKPEVQGSIPWPVLSFSLFTFFFLSFCDPRDLLAFSVGRSSVLGTASIALCAVKGGFQ